LSCHFVENSVVVIFVSLGGALIVNKKT